jgi:glycosyltransferase involved in cell wall biosynthesis
MPEQIAPRLNRLLVFNLMTDADDPILGFTTAWLNELAARCDAVDTVTMQAGRLETAPNVRVFSVGKERGYSEPRRAVEFYSILGRLLGENRYAACFAHMMPLFAVMGAPLLKLYRVPITLWYTHSAVGLMLRLAEMASDHVVSASKESFRLSSRKLILAGHGIDTEQFAPAPPGAERPFTIGTTGRVGPKKQTALLIEAARLLAEGGIDGFALRLVGGPLPGDEAYAERLKAAVDDYGLADKVTFAGGVRFDQVAEEYRRMDAMVNMSLTGSIDKAVLEAMACGLPVVTGNEAFFPVLERWRDLLIVPRHTPEALADRLRGLICMPVDERSALGLALRQVVIDGHSLDKLMDRLVEMWAGEQR